MVASEVYDAGLMCALLQRRFRGQKNETETMELVYDKLFNLYYLRLHCLPKLRVSSSAASLSREEKNDGQLFAL